MKLYEIPNGSKIYCKGEDGSSYLTFNHIDGMYSHCTTEKGSTAHLGASTELTKTEGGYKLTKQL